MKKFYFPYSQPRLNAAGDGIVWDEKVAVVEARDARDALAKRTEFLRNGAQELGGVTYHRIQGPELFVPCDPEQKISPHSRLP